jgi:hypothetical protein
LQAIVQLVDADLHGVFGIGAVDEFVLGLGSLGQEQQEERVQQGHSLSFVLGWLWCNYTIFYGDTKNNESLQVLVYSKKGGRWIEDADKLNTSNARIIHCQGWHR